MELRHVPEWSVVLLPDGILGCKGRSGRKGKEIIVLADSPDGVTRGKEMRPSDEVKVVKYPAQLAGEYVNAHSADTDIERLGSWS